MTFNKAYLFATLIVSSIILTACNEKNPPKDNLSQTVQPASEQTGNELSQQLKVDEPVNQAALEFQKVVNVAVTNISVPEEEKSFAITYEITNLTEKAISSLQWITIYKADGKAFYVANIPALQFQKTIAPKATETITLSTTEDAVLEQIRPYMKPGANIQVELIGTMVNFKDGSTVGLTPTK